MLSQIQHHEEFGSRCQGWKEFAAAVFGVLVIGLTGERAVAQSSPAVWQGLETCSEKMPADDAVTLVSKCHLSPAKSWAALKSPTASAIAQPDADLSLPVAEHPSASAPPAEDASQVQKLDVDPAIIESSPVLERWLEEIPDVATDIQHDPAFRTRIRLGYAEFPSADNTGGLYVGVQDVFVGQTPLTLSAEYAVNSRGDRELIGMDAQYYLLPLGWYGNVAPVVGYRSIDTPQFESSGINLGFKIVLIPSRGGGADLSITQSWVSPGSSEEVGLTTLSVGYAVAPTWRIGTDIQTQNTPERQESRVSLLLEWLP